jgi:RNA polymerase sigma-70 factor (ECF subfamily)
MLRLHPRRAPFKIRTLQEELRTGLVETLSDASGELDVACARVAEQVTARWPVGWVPGVMFGRYLGRRVEPGDAVAALAELCVADLYLACAVTAGVPAALAAFDRILVTELPPAIRTVEPKPDTVDEVLQQLRERLLVPHQGAARLESYSGHGPLGAWLRVSALRVALALRRRYQPELAPDEELAQILDLAPNAEVSVLARELGADLRAALRAAITAQPARARAVLRMYYGDGHGVEDIGRAYRVHASSVSRWLMKARAEILAHVRAELVARFAASESQIDSLLGHAASLEISLESLLRSAEHT